MTALVEEIRAIEATLGGGTLGVCSVGSATGEVISYNADVVFPTASVIKAAIVAEMYAQVEEGALTPDRIVSVHPEEIVAGSGVLSHLTPATALYTLDDLATLAIMISDNTASNMVLAGVDGPEGVNRRMHEEWGMTNTTIHRPIKFHLEPNDPPHTATGTPADMCRFMNAIANGTLHSPAVCERMMALLAICDDTSMLPRYLEVNAFAGDLETAPPPLTVHHKPGAVNGVRNDAGIVRQTVAPFGHVAMAIYTKGVTDSRWTAANRGCEAVAQVAKVLVDTLLVA